MTTYFTADTHFNHVRILEYCPRPWTFVEDMNEGLIKSFNAVVSPEDTVYILGDFAMGDKDKIPYLASRLNGKKILILGNHDYSKPGQPRKQLLNAGFEAIVERMMLEDSGKKLFLHHEPLPQSEWGGADLHLSGHVHDCYTRASHIPGQNIKPDPEGLILNVGVDVCGYKPMTLEQLLARPFTSKGDHRLETVL